MPITAKLSRKLYDTFGEEAAGEMIDWMQRVDAQRAELRELNELNELSVSRLDSRLNEVRADLEKKMETGFARLEARLEQRTADIMKWSFVFWVGSVLTIVGAMAALARFFS